MNTAVEYGVPTHRCRLQLRLGAEKQFFREEGIDLDLRIAFGGSEIAAGYDSGWLLVGEMGTPPGLTALTKGARSKIVGTGAFVKICRQATCRKRSSPTWKSQSPPLVRCRMPPFKRPSTGAHRQT